MIEYTNNYEAFPDDDDEFPVALWKPLTVGELKKVLQETPRLKRCKNVIWAGKRDGDNVELKVCVQAKRSTLLITYKFKDRVRTQKCQMHENAFGDDLSKAHGLMTVIAQEYAAGELEDQDLYPTRNERILANGGKVRASQTVLKKSAEKGSPKDVSEHRLEVDIPLCTESADAVDDSFFAEVPGMLMDDGVQCSFQVEIVSKTSGHAETKENVVAILRFLVVLTSCSAESSHTLRVGEAPLLLSMLLRSNLVLADGSRRLDILLNPSIVHVMLVGPRFDSWRNLLCLARVTCC